MFLVKTLAEDHFGPGDRHLLQAYCEAYNDLIEAQQTIKDEGRYVTGGSGGKKRHPAIADVNDARNAMSMLATKLRLCANSRIDKHKAGREKAEPQSKRAGLMFGGGSA